MLCPKGDMLPLLYYRVNDIDTKNSYRIATGAVSIIISRRRIHKKSKQQDRNKPEERLR